MPPTRRRMSLTALVELVLGLPLDKTQQCSSWGARPLLPLQLRYAAADAHALVALYQALQKRRRGLETPFWLSQFSGAQGGFREEGQEGRSRVNTRDVCCWLLSAHAAHGVAPAHITSLAPTRPCRPPD